MIRAEIIRFNKRYAILDTGFKGISRFNRRNLKPSQLVREAPVRLQAQSAWQVAVLLLLHIAHLISAAQYSLLCAQ